MSESYGSNNQEPRKGARVWDGIRAWRKAHTARMVLNAILLTDLYSVFGSMEGQIRSYGKGVIFS